MEVQIKALDMMTDNPVRAFLEKGDYSFSEGVAVLLLYGSNERLNRSIEASRDKRRLHYELCQLSHHPNLKPRRSARSVSSAIGNRKACSVVQAKAETRNRKTQEKTQPHNSTVSYATLKHHENTKFEDMPTKVLQELWLKNRDEYKEFQHCHQMMKEANSDVGRADWRRQVDEHWHAIRKRWRLIDEGIADFEARKKGETEEEINIGSYRSDICKLLKKSKLTDAQRLRLQLRVTALVELDVPIAEKTLERLKAIGIEI